MSSLPNESLFLSESFSDVTFIVEDKSIPAHKIILAANCPYFKTMLFGATNESKMSSIQLNDVSFKVFVEVLRCVYLRQINIGEWTPDEVKNLIQKANDYQFLEMASIIAESLNIDTQVTIDIIEVVVGVAVRLNCNGLMEKCAEAARKQTELLFTNEAAFDKLPMDLIVYLIDAKIWNPADARLVYSIGNWRKAATIEDKKRLLSKIDWNLIPGKYSEPLVRMFLEDDVDGLHVKDWTQNIKIPLSVDVDLIAGIYSSSSKTFYETKSDCENFLKSFEIVLSFKYPEECVFIFFRESVASVHRIKFRSCYSIDPTCIYLKLYGDQGVHTVKGKITHKNWQFDIPLNVTFWSAALHFKDIATGRWHNDYRFGDLAFCCENDSNNVPADNVGQDVL